ncbi:MAG: ureidoglycolate lyase [Victivallaceae bacterium]|nr:ureidoglycolate lyase [Victivallaceae bacterium]
MKSVKVQKLSVEKFAKYGSFAALINPDAETTGSKDASIVFYRDMVQQELFGRNPSFSTCRMKPRPMVIDAGEYHNHTCEVSMPLNADALVWVAPADCSKNVPVDKIEVFLVPRGTILSIRPGVWHHAAFAIDNQPLDVMIVLPERAYVNDCVGVAIPKADQRKIQY